MSDEIDFQPSASADGIDFQTDKSLSGFASNAWEDTKGTLKGIGALADNLIEDPINTVKAIPGGLVNEGKRIGLGELLTGHPINAIEKFGNAAYDKPLSTALDVAPVVGAASKLLSGGAAAAGGAEEAANAARVAAEGASPVAEAAKAAEAAPKELPVIKPGSTVGDPHALFAYNEKLGPEFPEESKYQLFGDPNHPVFQSGKLVHGSQASLDQLKEAGVPVVGRTPRSVGQWEPLDELGQKPAGEVPPESAAPPKAEVPPAAKDPLQEVKDYINSKYGKAAAQPGFAEKAANYLEQEARRAGGRDLGLQGLQARQMGEGLAGVKKAEQLIDYAREQGYLKPGLTDIGRKQLLESNLDKAGKQVGAIRDLADKRGAPPIDQMYEALKTQLTDKYSIKAPGEVEKVLAQVQKAMKESPTFSGMADISTDLNKELKNVRSMGRHVGPNTDAADLISRMNNDAIRGKLNPQESELYTKSLRDFGAHKKLEKVIAGSERKGLTGRGAPGSITNRLLQSVLDRGGYRVAGNVADRMAKKVLQDPSKFKTLPDFFEDLVHQSEDVANESVDHPGMFQGGTVPDDVRRYVQSKSC